MHRFDLSNLQHVFFAQPNKFQYTESHTESQLQVQARQRVSKNGNILVTGATGFIGSHLVEKLLADGLRVRCIVRPGRTVGTWIDGLPLDVVEADLTASTSLDAAFENVDTVIHVAGVTKAKRERDYMHGNVDATSSLLRAAGRAGVRRFTFISSQTVAGPSPDGRPLTEDDPCRPLTAYARSKRECELMCLDAATSIPMTIIRPSAVYGPRDRDTLEMFRWVRYGIRPVIGSADKTLSLVHVRDLVEGIFAATFDNRGAGRLYFVADSEPYRFDNIIEALSRVMNKQPVAIHFPSGLLFTVAAIVQGVSFFGTRPAVLSIDKARDMIQSHWVCNPNRIAQEIGFRSILRVSEGFQETYDWYRANRWL
ncbi:MAG: hypothetical protein A2X67_00715 [Ignavibacteria bacterium GWA2_55_11]|nr:MAG: hypothetical protein A2X67_00715 [Ignavibacteria bacterium GWA2_55_11]OGU44634.1 MAG: hypothetical protein A2X68_10885 [Ignavibacteria bacterium GWC2_56_12]OGU62901.1 MAG: hypothetical protein A3C56_02740 [Ignavibacteria bacterium RIFCSPHIGHO2_02_FULL_56_12]OGU68994.1 MAG: hypothetical protein A3H45_15620 [Ignavibacteria bacterium RIFCSPLOWO2_02_FULL_55_14]OGU76144.1 MAG: hypothetical protein A3G43_06550 [Ignavibacteria bacterium RIFCSPLOWO2_12_FULL_56_21]